MSDRYQWYFDRRKAYSATRQALERMFDGSLDGNPAEVKPEDIAWAVQEIQLRFPSNKGLGKHLTWIRDQINELMDPCELKEHPEAQERGALTLRAEQLTAKQKADLVRDVQALRRLLERGE